MLVNIEKVSILKNDERGISYDFSTQPNSYFIFIHRKQGTISGAHYHKGEMVSKSPEVIYFVSGMAKLTVRDISGSEEETYHLEEGTKIEIPPNIYHELLAETDIILMEPIRDREDFELYDSDTVKIR